jgi:hypothetical protein
VLLLYVNFFQPSMKLVTKRYDKAQTPYQRVLSSTAVRNDLKELLSRQYEALDPIFLLRELEQRQDQFWQHPWGKTAALSNETPTLVVGCKAIQESAGRVAMCQSPPHLYHLIATMTVPLYLRKFV